VARKNLENAENPHERHLITPVIEPPPASNSTPPPTRDWSDRVALGITRGLRFLADTFFAKRYGNRAIVLETVAAVPGLVGAALIHLRCLR
jgi:ubiquinol oxidase